ncbi:hypothetical protein LOK49_LG08G01804 [Camellia lanceoleosa]|uniref:Uncharacterized protein n=1 Tax=Camellia lanceoleosa TaxID=1840588 RepID=A0ACC0GW57_9ERIC|nr:hypothetical protein LOK49_LG08G01804 [Camellia lanceoleosa]
MLGDGPFHSFSLSLSHKASPLSPTIYTSSHRHALFFSSSSSFLSSLPCLLPGHSAAASRRLPIVHLAGKSPFELSKNIFDLKSSELWMALRSMDLER